MVGGPASSCTQRLWFQRRQAVDELPLDPRQQGLDTIGWSHNLPHPAALLCRWEEERQRCGGQDPPPPPPDPLRTPKPLCLVVDYVRSQFQVHLPAAAHSTCT